MTRFEHVRRWALRDPDRTAVTWNGGSWSYRVLFEKATALAVTLEQLGARRGDRVAVLAENTPGTVAAVLAIQAIGSTLVPVNFRLTPEECDKVLADAECFLLLCGESEAELTRQLAISPALQFGFEGETEPAGGPAGDIWRRDRWPELAPDSIETIIYTSGTTGLPKGVVMTPTMVTTLALGTAQSHSVSATSCWLQALPYFSAASLNLSINTIFLVGGRLHLIPSRRFRAGDFLEESARCAATHTELVPTQLYRILDAIGGAPYKSSYVTIGYGSAPISDTRLDEALRVFGSVFIQAYGMTETTCQATLLEKEDHVPGSAQLKSAGRAVPYIDVMVASDESLQEVPVGEEGEIVFRGITVTPGYWRPGGELDRTGFDGEWIRSGDIGRVDQNGYIYVVDRKKDLVISGGFNISAREVEDVIYQINGVLECAVVASRHAAWGEVPVAVVVPRDNVQLTEAEILDHCRSHLAGYKVPARVTMVQDLPKNSIGKILKREIRRQLAEAG